MSEGGGGGEPGNNRGRAGGRLTSVHCQPVVKHDERSGPLGRTRAQARSHGGGRRGGGSSPLEKIEPP